MTTTTWVLLAVGVVLIVLDIVLRRRGVLKDRTAEVKKLLVIRVVVLAVVAVALLIGVLVT